MTYPVFQNSRTVSAVTLDNNFLAVGRNAIIPCAVSGTNALTLTPTPSSTVPSVVAYANYMTFAGVFGANATTGSVTFAVGALTALNGYVDSLTGPRLMQGDTAVQNNSFLATYDSALGSGAGGFHVRTMQLPASGGSVSSINLGGYAALLRSPSSQVSIAFGVINPNSEARATVGLTGARFLDQIMLGAPSTVSTGVMFDGFVAATDTVVARAINASGGTITLAGAMYRLNALGFG